MNSDIIVTFDAYGTLFKINLPAEEAEKILGSIYEPFMECWRTKLLEYSWLSSLMNFYLDFNSIIQKALAFSCLKFDLKQERVIPALMELYQNPILFPEVKELLIKMKEKRMKTCILSNGEKHTLENAVQDNQIEPYILKIFSASAAKKYKVHPSVYQLVLTHFQKAPEQIYFVSSNSWDIMGASKFGFKTIWINRSESHFDTLGPKPNYELNNLSEIIEIILQ